MMAAFGQRPSRRLSLSADTGVPDFGDLVSDDDVSAQNDSTSSNSSNNNKPMTKNPPNPNDDDKSKPPPQDDTCEDESMYSMSFPVLNFNGSSFSSLDDNKDNDDDNSNISAEAKSTATPTQESKSLRKEQQTTSVMTSETTLLEVKVLNPLRSKISTHSKTSQSSSSKDGGMNDNSSSSNSNSNSTKTSLPPRHDGQSKTKSRNKAVPSFPSNEPRKLRPLSTTTGKERQFSCSSLDVERATTTTTGKGNERMVSSDHSPSSKKYVTSKQRTSQVASQQQRLCTVISRRGSTGTGTTTNWNDPAATGLVRLEPSKRDLAVQAKVLGQVSERSSTTSPNHFPQSPDQSVGMSASSSASTPTEQRRRNRRRSSQELPKFRGRIAERLSAASAVSPKQTVSTGTTNPDEKDTDTNGNTTPSVEQRRRSRRRSLEPSKQSRGRAAIKSGTNNSANQKQKEGRQSRSQSRDRKATPRPSSTSTAALPPLESMFAVDDSNHNKAPRQRRGVSTTRGRRGSMMTGLPSPGGETSVMDERKKKSRGTGTLSANSASAHAQQSSGNDPSSTMPTMATTLDTNTSHQAERRRRRGRNSNGRDALVQALAKATPVIPPMEAEHKVEVEEKAPLLLSPGAGAEKKKAAVWEKRAAAHRSLRAEAKKESEGTPRILPF